MQCRSVPSRHLAVARLVAVGACTTAFAVAQVPNYNVTDITNWTPAQLATLPFFKHYRPSTPLPNAPVDFHFAARTASGLTVGSTWNVFSGPDERGVLLTATAAHTIDSFGDFHWWRTSPPAAATYRITNAFDVNWSGVVVGTANMPGTSTSSSAGPDMHAIVYDVVHGKTDIAPGSSYGWATCINNRGEIGGYAYGGSGPIQSAFRRSPEGDFTPLDPVPPGYMPTPKWINAQGVIVGMSVPGGWASPADQTVVPLPKLFGMPLATVTDLNDAGWIVGTSEQWDHTERYATLWQPTGGTWVARDLTNYVNSPNLLLDGVLAINNTGHLIAFGHGDGGPPVSGLFLLTPTGSGTSSCVPDIGRHPENVTATGSPTASAPVSLAIAGGTTPTAYAWQLEASPGVWITLGNAPTALPCGGQAFVAPANASAVTVSVTPCAGRVEYPVRCVVTNTCGSATSNTAIVSVGHMASYEPYGSGCAGSLGVPSLQVVAGRLPVIGAVLQVQIGNLPNNIALMAFGLSDAMTGSTPLPLDLGAFGMPTCQLLVDPAATYLLAGTGGTAAWTWNVPADPSLSGMSLYNQAFAIDPAANSVGLAASNGGVGSIGL